MTEVSTYDKFCIKLDEACKCYEMMKSIISREYVITDRDHNEILGAGSTIAISLAKEFIFEAARAYRICEHSWNLMGINKIDMKIFITSLQNLIRSRDVNEHWTDSVNIKQKSRPQKHKVGEINVDDTSFIIINGNLSFGNLELDKYYRAVKKMNDLYGWKARAMKSIVEKKECEI
ncbi:hypothetical protein ACQW08_04575 [Gluconobacter japonicus]|uniref:hypothetical protein n=1 Tax=Gluconobacter japonicus TaxID=376620 RepID=UPI003D2D53A6